jgi:WD40 repeat protein
LNAPSSPIPKTLPASVENRQYRYKLKIQKMKSMTIKTSLVFASLTIIFLNISKAQTIDWSMKGNPLNLTVNGVAFRADGQKVVSGTNCHPASIRMFDVASSNLDWDHNVGMTYMCIMGVTFSSNSNYIAAIEEFGNIFIFDNTGVTPVITDTINTGTSYGFSSAISPTNDKVAVGCSNGKLKIYNLPGGSLSNDINAHPSWVTTVCYSPDGSKIITGGNDDKVKIWSNTGSLLFTCSSHTGDVTNVKVTPDNNFVISSSKDDKIKIWNIATGALVQTIAGHTSDVNGIDISPDGSKIVSASSDSTCKIWNFNTGGLITTFAVADSGSVNTVAWSPNGDKIVTGNILSDVVLWSIPATLNISETVVSDYLNIYPNPTHQQLNFELQSDPKNAQFIIYNELGQLQKIFSKISIRNISFDISELSEGQYYGVFVDGNNRIASKFIVTK